MPRPDQQDLIQQNKNIPPEFLREIGMRRPNPSTDPDLAFEVNELGDDAYAASFQSMAGYRTALIAKVKGWLDEYKWIA